MEFLGVKTRICDYRTHIRPESSIDVREYFGNIEILKYPRTNNRLVLETKKSFCLWDWLKALVS